jgi:TonB family protein
MMKYLSIVAFAAAAFLCATGAARAEVEFCPAYLHGMKAVDMPVGTDHLTAFTYELRAGSQRVIANATFVADTDQGWYGWNVADIPIGTSKRSDVLSVTFPLPVTVRHAWVTNAALVGDDGYGWKDLKSYPCEVPVYANRGIPEAAGERPQSRKPSASPSPIAALPVASPGAKQSAAFPVAIPFDSIDCTRPFGEARVTTAQGPDYPRGYIGAEGSTQVAVQIDEQGHLIDSWVYKSFGIDSFDASALRAARLSTYAPAVSYCQNVLGTYIFSATFQGHH